MPLLTINNLLTNNVVVQDPTGYSSLSLQVPGSGSITNLAVTEAQVAAIEGLLNALQTASSITWTVAENPADAADTTGKHQVAPTTTPYNAVAGDQLILTNRTTSGAMSVVLSASASVGQAVTVIDLKGDAATNNVTVTVASAGTINGASSVVINTNSGWAFLVKNSATNWQAVLSTQISTSAAGGDLTGTYPNPTLVSKIMSAPAALSGAGTLSVTSPVTLFTSTGAGNALVLPDGTKNGQLVTVIHTVKGASGTGVITPTHAGNFATCTLTAKWDFATFSWSGTAWNVVAAAGAFAGLA